MAISSGFSIDNFNAILKKVRGEDILAYYLGITEIPCKIQAPYRVDNKPSVGIYMGKSNKVQFIDFATKECGGVADLLSKVWNLDFKHTVERIAQDLNKIKPSTEIKSTTGNHSTPVHHITNSTIEVKFRDWKSYDLEYWESYGISLPWLKFGDVYPISHIFLTKNGVTSTFPAEKYAYAYVERKDGNISLKIYQPFSDTKKWMNKHDASVWDLWTKLPEKGDQLIITSSRKDALCIWENTGIPSVSLQGEGYIPKEQVVQELKERFKEIFILYDNDFQSRQNHGRIFGADLAKRFNLIQLEIPDEFYSKDTSDLCKNHGRETVNRVILSLINPDDLPF